MPIHPEDLNAFRPYLATPVEVSSYSDAVQRTLLLAYYCGLVAGLRPLLILGIIGQKDSGKTVLARSILRAILGSDANVIALPEKAKDFYVLAAGQPLLCLDNLDEPADARWLPDAMATVATGGAWKGRKLFTDAGIHSSELDAALMLTSRTAVWARADIAERTLPIFPQAFADDQRQPDSFLTEELMAGRSGVLVWLIETAHKLLAWLPQAPVGLPARFLDFGRLVWAYCAATGQPDAAVPILEALRKAQALSIADADPLLAAILEFGPQVTMTNLTPRDLVRALTAAGADLPLFGGGKAIARKLRELKGTLLQAGWHLDEHKSGSATVFTLSM